MVKAHVELLGSPTGDSNRSALLFFDEERYLFECGDGTQRLCTEYGVSIATEKLKQIFVSRMHPSSVGGILGLALTVADSGKKSLHFVGPEGLEKFLDAAKPFFYRPKMSIRVTEVAANATAAPCIVSERNNVTIEAVPITSTQQAPTDSARATTEPVPKRAKGAAIICYVCRITDLPGKFDPAKAAALGIPRGPMFGSLTKGRPVTLADGRVVTPDQVISPSTPGPIVIFASCPDENHVPAIASNVRLSNGLINPSFERRVCILHYAPRSVLQNDRYRLWLSSFGKAATHIVVDETVNPLRPIFRGNADAICRANAALGSDYAPVPHGLDLGEEDTVLSDLAPPSAGDMVAGDTLLRFGIAPLTAVGLDASRVPATSIGVESIRSQVLENELVKEEIARLETVPSPGPEPPYLRSLSDRAAEIRFLGTAAAMPGKLRNVSGILLNLFDRGCILLDCGEGSYGQMVRCLGRSGADEAVLALRFVWISHMHADHHLGLLQILAKRRELDAESPLVVVGPARLRTWLLSFDEMFSVSTFIFIDASQLIEPQEPIASYFPENFGVILRCCEVVHCPQAYGVAIEDCVSQWKVCYSGDTRPCKALVQIGQNSTLAIHEATLEDGMEEEAEEKAHCTFTQALETCEKMNAYRTILTHFSQRYPRVPVVGAAVHRLDQVAVAFDFLRVNFKDLAKLPQTLPLLLSLYPNEVPAAGE